MKIKEVKKKNKLDWNEIKESIKKGFKKFLHNIKKAFAKLWKSIKRIAKQLKDKFMELPKKIRMIIYVWAVVLLLLIIFIAATSGAKNFYAKYNTYESNISEATLKYIKDKNIYTTSDKKIIVDLAVLKEENYVSSLQIDDDTCDGISVVYYDDQKDEYVIESYLNCKRYTSKYYWDYK